MSISGSMDYIVSGYVHNANINWSLVVLYGKKPVITVKNGEFPIIFKKFPDKKDVNIANTVTNFRNNNEVCGYFFSWGNVTDAPDDIIGGYVLFFAEPQVTGNTCLIYLTSNSVYFGRIYQGVIYWSTRVASIH